MKWGVFIIFLVTLLADIYIYRSVICVRFKRLPPRVGYIIFALLTAAAGLSIFLLYGFASNCGSAAVITVMWLVWVFFLTALPKLLFAAAGVLDWLISAVVRKKLVIFRPLVILLSLIAIIMMIYGATGGRSQIRVTELALSSEHLPESFDGYRIVQFSDLHAGTMCNQGKMTAKMVSIVNSLDADLIVNTGDIVNIDHRDLSWEISSALSRLQAPDGIVSVLGNHDLGLYIKDTLSLPLAENAALLRAKFAAMGWRTLQDESFYLYRGGDSISITGLNFPSDRLLSAHNGNLSGIDMERAFKGVDRQSYSIVFSHAPQTWNDIVDAGFGDLTLSGHVHSMQLKIRFFGYDWSPSKYFYREWSGLYEKNKKYLYINDGIGCVGYPMRIGTRPELTLITLKRCE